MSITLNLIEEDDVCTSEMVTTMYSETDELANTLYLIVNRDKKHSITHLNNALAYYSDTFPVLPFDISNFADCVTQYVREVGGIPKIESLAYCLANFKYVVRVNGEWKDLNDYKMPYHQTIDYLSGGLLSECAIETDRGIVYLGDNRGDRIIDYIGWKYDGSSIKTIVVSVGEQMYTLVVRDRDSYMVNGAIGPIAGEVMVRKKKIMLYHGYSVPQTKISLDGNEYEWCEHVPLTVSMLINSDMPDDADGLIVSIEGIEYRVKKRITLECFYNSQIPGLVFTSDKRQLLVSNIDLSRETGIYEVEDTDQGWFVRRMRPDRRVAQPYTHYEHMRQCVNYDQFVRLIECVKGMLLEPFHNKYPDEMILSAVQLDLLDTSCDEVTVSPFIILRMCQKRKIYISYKKACHIYTQLGGGCEMYYRLRREELLRKCITPFRYATCKEIYDCILKNKISGEPYVVASIVAEKTKSIVSVRKIVLMARRCELLVVGSIVTVCMIAGVCNPYVSRITPRCLSVSDVMSPLEGFLFYARYNNGRFAVDNDIALLKSECVELSELITERHALEEIGDCFAILTKVVLRIYTTGEVFKDENSLIWNELMALPIMQPYFEKIKKRLSRYKCIRNHTTAGTHVCSSGKEFVPFNCGLSQVDSPDL